MVGEMRDKETVSTGIEASLTGHLVFATLHTNSAPESIVRLLDMGMDPFNFSDALLGILAQRLAKRLCKCKEASCRDARGDRCAARRILAGAAVHAAWKEDAESRAREASASAWIKDYGNERARSRSIARKAATSAPARATRAAWVCTSCSSAPTASSSRSRSTRGSPQMLVTALEDGMRTLKQDGIEKVLQGITDMAAGARGMHQVNMSACRSRRTHRAGNRPQGAGAAEDLAPASRPARRDRRRALERARHRQAARIDPGRREVDHQCRRRDALLVMRRQRRSN